MDQVFYLLIILMPIVGIFYASQRLFFIQNKGLFKLDSIAYLIITLISFLSTVFVYFKNDLSYTYDDMPGFGIDGISAIFLMISQFFLLFIGIFSVFYFEEEKRNRFFTFYYGLNLGLNLVFTAQNYFVLFISWELLVICGYILVSFNNDEQAREASFKYLIISSLGSLIMLFGIALLSGIHPGLSLTAHELDLNSLLIGKIAFSLLIAGFGTTGGFIILNIWLPDAHPAAPSPVSALLSGIMVKTGLYGMYRTIHLFYPNLLGGESVNYVIMSIAVLTMFEGNIMVINQLQRTDKVDFKRILAYSTIVHLGFLLLMVPLNSKIGVLALIYHIINHGLAKISLFLISGVFLKKLGSKDLQKLKGIGNRDVFLGFAIFVSFMSLAGFPATGGFVSKLLILLSIGEGISDLNTTYSKFLLVILIATVINSFLAFVGYLWVIRLILLEPEQLVESQEYKTLPNENILKGIVLMLTLFIFILGILPMIFISEITPMLP